MTFKLLHTADWHRGAPNEHPVFQAKTIPSIFQVALNEECKYILMVGDLFDKPRPDQATKDLVLKQIAKHLRKDLTIIFIAGNHDYTTKARSYHSLEYLRILQKLFDKLSPGTLNIHVVEPGTFQEFPDFDLYVMTDWNVPKDLKSKPGKPLILAWHGTVPGMDYANLEAQPPGTKEAVDNLRKATGAAYVALGDIHRCMRIAPFCWYPGPPVQKTYADKDGVLVATFAAGKISIKKHRLALPKKINLKLTFTEGKDTEQSIIDFVLKEVAPKNLVKLQFSMPLSVWGSLNKNYIKTGLAEHCLELVLENDPEPEYKQGRSIDKISKAGNIFEELGIILEEEEFGLDKVKLNELCKRYIE